MTGLDDVDAAAVAADDAILTNLGAGGAPMTTDPTEWLLLALRDDTRFQTDQPKPWQPFVPLEFVFHATIALLTLSVLFAGLSLVVAPGAWMVTCRALAGCAAICACVVAVCGAHDADRVR